MGMYDYNLGEGYTEYLQNFARFVELNGRKYPWLVDFTHIFDGVDKPVYYDKCHVFQDANKIIASKILDIILKAL